MRLLSAFVFTVAVIIGVHHASSQAAPAAPTAPQACFVEPGAVGSPGLETALVPPACNTASQCVDYCAGGTPLCFAHHCSCAS